MEENGVRDGVKPSSQAHVPVGAAPVVPMGQPPHAHQTQPAHSANRAPSENGEAPHDGEGKSQTQSPSGGVSAPVVPLCGGWVRLRHACVCCRWLEREAFFEGMRVARSQEKAP